MAPWVKYDDIISILSVEEVLRSYGLEIAKRTGDELRLLCPIHEEKTPSFCININGKFKCFGCHAKGSDILDLVRLKEDYGPDRNKGRRQAAIFLAERFGLSTTPPSKRGKTNAKTDLPVSIAPEEKLTTDEPAKEEVPEPPRDEDEPLNPPLKFELRNIDPTHPYLFERGLTEETIRTFGIGYFPGKGTMHGRIIIPIHNEHGQLVAYAGRWPGDPPEDEPKYKLPPNFHKSLVLYNLRRAREYAAEGFIVVEGFFSVFELWQRGRRNVVAIMGSSMSEAQERLIVESIGSRGRVLLTFDHDEAGRKGMQDAAARLYSQVFVRTTELS